MSTESEQPCYHFDKCGNIVPGGLSLCDQCRDEARRRQRKFHEENPRATMADYGDHLKELGY